ncbi:MAG: VWA domain-containing protein [Deltaproteobacteria bacterium]|nr:VWA domain-containing protein [Deltaproteobacteria bacterium]
MFPGLFDGDFSGTFRVNVKSGAAETTVDNVSAPTWETPVAVQPAGQAPPSILDLMFMIDTTGSMCDELSYLQTELADVIGRVEDDFGNVLIRLSVNFYRDSGDDYVVRSFPFSTDIDDSLTKLAAQSCDGGGDYPEAVHTALADAVFEHTWSAAARARLLFLVLDAPPHYTTSVVESLHQTMPDAAEKGIRIVPVAGERRR